MSTHVSSQPLWEWTYRSGEEAISKYGLKKLLDMQKHESYTCYEQATCKSATDPGITWEKSADQDTDWIFQCKQTWIWTGSPPEVIKLFHVAHPFSSSVLYHVIKSFWLWCDRSQAILLWFWNIRPYWRSLKEMKLVARSIGKPPCVSSHANSIVGMEQVLLQGLGPNSWDRGPDWGP